MKSCKRVLSLFISFCLLISVSVLAAPVTQADTPESAQTYVSDLIAYYRDYQEDATTDIMRTLDQLKKVDEGQYEAWSKIMDYWSYINTEMKVNIGVTEDGLPQDDSLCIVILGFALNPDGTMKEELIHRLEAGLASAEKYPNAYVVVTGGGTAAENPNVTEGGLMGEWLLEHGLDESRLIVENRAPSTVGNAENTFKILTEEYPQVKNIVMVTSDYHVPRGCILFYSKFVLSALASGKEPLNIVSNAGCYTGSQGYESIALQASGVASVAGVIAFLGLIAPHIAFLLLGRRGGPYLPLCALMGGAILLAADLLARGFSQGAELPLSIWTVLFGAPVLTALLLRGREESL